MSIVRTDSPITRVEVTLRLDRHLTMPSLALLGACLRRQSHHFPATRFLLDCTDVKDLSAFVLEQLHEIRSDLQTDGSDLALVECCPALLDVLTGSAHDELLAQPEPTYVGHVAQGPHFARLGRFARAE